MQRVEQQTPASESSCSQWLLRGGCLSDADSLYQALAEIEVLRLSRQAEAGAPQISPSFVVALFSRWRHHGVCTPRQSSAHVHLHCIPSSFLVHHLEALLPFSNHWLVKRFTQFFLGPESTEGLHHDYHSNVFFFANQILKAIFLY